MNFQLGRTALNLAILVLSVTIVAGCIDISGSGSTDTTDTSTTTSRTTSAISNPMSEQEIDDFIQAINQYRAEGASCGTQGVFGAQAPLVWNQKLAVAAQVHSNDQYEMNDMSHTGSDGSKPSERITLQGYEWSSVRENVAEGYFSSISQLAKAWMDSDGHCANMMASNVTELGIAATRLDNGSGFWTLKLAKPKAQ
ncbi:MAG: CAP domain-containing protein [Marinospirillum sp.]|uniref:CAP domain-containing protein n=1 Tax=Marinospirillum sp. TaxID=2183934 RepID=UPI0019EABEDF|nr:CAP domain-containing protein [Marinospirillum sp.]MBE0507709.1 CAP domain-containing protein [Marinospirillum sp.]